MIRYYFLLLTLLFSAACNTTPAKDIPAIKEVISEEKLNFFPVTAYVKGQLHDILQKGLTPVHYITQNNHTDSVMVKFEKLNELCKEFLQPEIDSANMITYFTETKFLDQSLDAFTFTYDVKPEAPDSIKLKHWDIYINPATSKVKRIYWVKEPTNNTILQLTWQSNQWCKIVTITKNTDGSSAIIKEEKISWDY